MKETRRATVAVLAALLLGGFAATVFAAGGIQGSCADCHTMHNSEQNQKVARTGTARNLASETGLKGLLRYDCMACHAGGRSENVYTAPGGSKIPQVYHNGAADLAAGNFAYLDGFKSSQQAGSPSGSRKGHNVIDLVPKDDVLQYPPGFKHGNDSFFFDLNKFTCAGNFGCHGFRGQMLTMEDEFGNGENTWRAGMEALSGYDGSGATTKLIKGAHHGNYDGLKTDGSNPDFYNNPLAHSYRFIRALKGYGNEVDRWQNVDSTSHNEYSGGYITDVFRTTNYTTDPGPTVCNRCHTGTMSTTSRMVVPGQTMTGFCVTCHSDFHSSGVMNGTSGAFLRHPSDYAIPDSGEYAAYTTYNVTAPVARPVSGFVAGLTVSSEVNHGADMVMCLSCHVAHASPYDGMLRFDYKEMTAGNAGDWAGQGCLACHTAKAAPPVAPVEP